jgi:hypothetical protein
VFVACLWAGVGDQAINLIRSAALGGLLLGSGNRATANPGHPISVHYTAIPLNPAKTVRLITLPTNPDLHAFAIAIS